MARKNLLLIDEPACKLQMNVLPTKWDIIKAVFFSKYLENASWKDAVTSVCEDVSLTWKNASIPTCSKVGIGLQMTNLVNKYKRLLESDVSRRNTAAFKTKSSALLVCFNLIWYCYSNKSALGLYQIIIDCFKRF